MTTVRSTPPVSLTILSLIAAFTGCAPAAARSAGESTADSPGLTLLVRNDNWLQVNVYVLRATTRYRLGTVSSMSTEIFRIPRHLYAATGTLQIRADPIGTQDTYTTEPIQIGLARQIELTVAEYLRNSRLMLR